MLMADSKAAWIGEVTAGNTTESFGTYLFNLMAQLKTNTQQRDDLAEHLLKAWRKERGIRLKEPAKKDMFGKFKAKAKAKPKPKTAKPIVLS